MFCPECGNQNPDTAKFCIKCGYNYSQTPNAASSAETIRQVERLVETPASSASNTQTFQSSPNLTPKSLNKKSIAPVISLIVGVAIIGVVTFFFVARGMQPSYTNINTKALANSPTVNTTTPSYSSQDSQPEAQSYQIVDEAFTVNARQMNYYEFTIPKNSGGGTVSGSFTASGGSDDIYVLVTNKTGLTNLKSGNNPKVFYDSGKVTTDEINVDLAPGIYYIVFSNLHSMMTPKAVNADVSVTY